MLTHVLYSFPTRLGVPGIGTTAWHQVQGLVDLGLRVTLYCGSVERPLRGAHRVVETMKLGGLRLPYRAIGLDQGMAWHDARVASAVRRHFADIDIIHCWPSGSLRTLKVAQKLNVPTVLERPSSHTSDVYDVARREGEKLGVPLKASQYANFNRKRLEREEQEFRLAQYLLCPSEAAANTFRARGFGDSQLRLHQYGFDPNLFSPQDPKPGAATPEKLRAIFAGFCFPLKGLHIALEAWTKSSASHNGEFAVCGDFDPDYKRLLAPYLSHPSVRILGFRRDVADLMRNRDVLIHPSLSEGSALVTYEAQACGLIPIVSDAAGAKCTHMRNALVHPAGNVSVLTEHLNLIASSPDLRRGLRDAVLAGAPELSWSAAARRLAQIYDEAKLDKVRHPKAEVVESR